jgi:hypothetical protein
VVEKPCSKCHVLKAASEFFRREQSHDGLQSWCRACKNAARQAQVRHPFSCTCGDNCSRDCPCCATHAHFTRRLLPSSCTQSTSACVLQEPRPINLNAPNMPPMALPPAQMPGHGMVLSSAAMATHLWPVGNMLPVLRKPMAPYLALNCICDSVQICWWRSISSRGRSSSSSHSNPTRSRCRVMLSRFLTQGRCRCHISHQKRTRHYRLYLSSRCQSQNNMPQRLDPPDASAVSHLRLQVRLLP